MTEPATPNADKFVAQYVALRDKLKAMDEEHEKRKKPVREALEAVGGLLTELLEKTNSEAISTEHGTCYTSTRYTASLADPQAFMDFVLSTRQFELLDRKANTTAVKAYVEEHKALPVGCNLTSIKTIGVRRK